MATAQRCVERQCAPQQGTGNCFSIPGHGGPPVQNATSDELQRRPQLEALGFVELSESSQSVTTQLTELKGALDYELGDCSMLDRAAAFCDVLAIGIALEGSTARLESALGRARDAVDSGQLCGADFEIARMRCIAAANALRIGRFVAERCAASTVDRYGEMLAQYYDDPSQLPMPEQLHNVYWRPYPPARSTGRGF